MKPVTALCALLGMLAATGGVALASESGSLVTTFGTGGSATVKLGTQSAAAAVAVQPNGDIVTAGMAKISGEKLISTRMTPSGALDPTYGKGGIVTLSGVISALVDSGAAIAIQPDGKIVIAAGIKRLANQPLEFGAVRLLPDGAPDPTFGIGGIATVPIGSSAVATAVVIQPDGKIVLAGSAVVGHQMFAAARLNPDGSLDTGFGNGGQITFGPRGCAWGAALQSNGEIVLGGEAMTSGHNFFMAARLTAAGQPDPGFGTGGIVKVQVGMTSLGFAVAVQPVDQKIVLAGPAYTSIGHKVAAAVRLNPDGSLDPTFGSGGISAVRDTHGVNDVTVDSSGRIIMATTGPAAVRLLPDGTPDASFGTSGNAVLDLGSRGGANGVAMTPDGQVVLAGAADISLQVVLTVSELNP